MEKEEYTCFYDPNFLSREPLTADNVIRYFSTSPFYQKNCLNELFKMQITGLGEEISKRLTTTPGFYYIVVYTNENLFVIAKKEFNGKQTKTHDIYYCMYGYIYAAPTLDSISDSRVTECLYNINTCINMYFDIESADWINTENTMEILKEEDKNLISYLNSLLRTPRQAGEHGSGFIQ